MLNRNEVQIAQAAIMGGSNEVAFTGNRGVWLGGGTVSIGIIRGFERTAHAQTIAKCRGDACNRLRDLVLATASRKPGDDCIVI